MEPILLVRNPKSGLVEREQEIEEGIKFLIKEGFSVVTVFITDILTKDRFFEKVSQFNSQTIMAVGGDGTVNLLSQYITGTDLRLAVIPAGTFNHFAKHIGIGTDVLGAFSTVIHGETILIDTAEVNGRIFVNFSCVGFYTQLIKRRVFYQKQAWKKWPAFFVSLYDSFIFYSPLKLTLIKNETEVDVTTPLVFVGNNIFNFGGADILAGRDNFTSGKLQLSTAAKMGRLGILFMLLRSFFGDIKYQAGFTTVALDEIEIRSRRPHMWVSLDGEVLKVKTPLKYKIHPQSLRVIIPKGEVSA